MKKILLGIIVAFAMMVGVNATEKNEVTLNFKDGIIHDGYVEYSKVANVQIFKGDTLVADITNNMVIDLNEAEYKFVIEEIENNSILGGIASIKLMINNWYYPITTPVIEGSKPEFKLDSNKFSGTLDIKFVRARTVVNIKVENIYDDISSKGVIDLSNGQEYVIDFTKDDELTQGLKSFADLDKTLYYQVLNGGLIVTNDESVAVLKIVGNKSQNKAILSAVNVGTKKNETFKGLHTKYTGSALDYNGTNDGIINETRFDYYTRCKYEYIIQYVKEKVSFKEYKYLDGDNQKYTINKDNDMIFKIDADYSLFDKIYIDNELVDENNYKVSEGSTIITFNKDFVSKLRVGRHELKVVFSDGDAKTNFMIDKEETVVNPSTVDNIEKYIAIGVVAVLGIIGSLVIIRKNNEK